MSEKPVPQKRIRMDDPAAKQEKRLQWREKTDSSRDAKKGSERSIEPWYWWYLTSDPNERTKEEEVGGGNDAL